MVANALRSPVVVDGIVSDEKLAELLALQAEYPELDYKSTIDLSSTEGQVELAKDIGAMQVRGGYIVVGVDSTGALTGQLDGVDMQRFDEARLGPMLLKWLPEPLELATHVAQRDGHIVVVIYVGPRLSGCAFFRADGQYPKNGKQTVAFRAGDAYWRDGTRSVRISQQGFEEIIKQRIARCAILERRTPPLVREATASEMGVRSPIQITQAGRLTRTGSADGPAYVRRDFDARLRAWLRDATAHGNGIVVLEGRSTTGKTYSLWEAVARELPDWLIEDCRDRTWLREVRLSAGRNVVIWLDELRPTDTPGILAASLRTLLRRPGRTGGLIIAATTWPPPVGRTTEWSDIHQLESEPDTSFADIAVPEQWSDAERDEATRIARQDIRLAIALGDRHFGPAQVLGGTPWLLRQWDAWQDQEAGAVINAAVDLSRLGVDILREGVLHAASRAYLTSTPRWRPTTWYTDALNALTAMIWDAVSALIQVPDETLEGIVGYRLCDTLQDYGGQRRHWVPIPDATWRAPLTEPASRTALRQLASLARNRLLYRLAEDIESVTSDAPPDDTAPPTPPPAPTPPQPASPPCPTPSEPRQPLTVSFEAPDRTESDRLYRVGDLDGLRALALPSNDTYVRWRLARLLADLNLEQELLDLAVFSRRAARIVAETWSKQGRVNDLLRQILCGNGFALRALKGWPISGLADEDRARILERGLHPDGTPT